MAAQHNEGGVSVAGPLSSDDLALVVDRLGVLEDELDLLFEHVPFGYHSLGIDGTYLKINSRELDWLGCTRDEVIGKMKPTDFLTTESLRKFHINFPLLKKHGHIENLELDFVGKNGVIKHTLLNATASRNAAGDFVCSRSVLYDITDKLLAEEEQRISAIAFNSQEGMMVTSPEGIIIRINSAFSQLTGYSEAEAIGKTPALLHSGIQGARFYQAMWAELKQKGYWQGEIWNKRKAGGTYAEWLTITAVRAPGGSVSHYVGTFSEITEHKEAEAKIHRLAYYDPLTNLPNRTLLLDRLAQSLANSNRSGHYGALIFIDLDNFKTLNDTMGHDAGDLLLIEVAKRLVSATRDADTVARQGGDEFVLILDDLGVTDTGAAMQARAIASSILQEIARPFWYGGHEFFFTASIGICLFHNHDEAVESLFKHADIAMYQVKSGGRNALRFFDPAMQRALDNYSALQSDLRAAAEKGQLLLYYQAQFNADQHILGAEALLRWQHPTRGLLYPIDFIPLAEETGLIVPVGRWALTTACRQLKAWAAFPVLRELTLAVNVSVLQFRQENFESEFAQILAETGANPALLKIELTESVMLDTVCDTVERMHRLKKLGVQFSLDDFGTGYSSLMYLKRLPLDQLKIDKSFVQDLTLNANDTAIVSTIISMGTTLGLSIIAEGVETSGQRQCLLDCGCHQFQGFLLSRPLPVAEFEKQVRSD